MGAEDCRIIDLPKIADPRGELTFVEQRRLVATLNRYPTRPHRQAGFASGQALPVAEVLILPMGPNVDAAAANAVVGAVVDAFG